MKSKILPIIIVILAVLLVTRISSLTITNHDWSPSSAYTNATLNCSWTPSGDTMAQNITILWDGAVFNDSYENASLVTLSTSFIVLPENTTKGEVWTCRVTLHNDTDNITSEKNITILNTPPATEGSNAGIFYSGVDIGYFFTVLEDSIYTIDVNATDADNDPIEYKPGEKFCTMTDETNGIYSCTPTQAYIINNSPTEVNISFTVWDPQNAGGRKVVFNITPVNDAPTFSPALANQSIIEGARFNYYISGADEENNTPFNFSINSSLSRLVINVTSNTSAVIMFTGNVTAGFDEAGDYPINVTVYDILNASTTSSFVLRINNTNIDPVIRRPIPNYTGNQTQPLSFNVSADAADVDHNLSFSISAIGCPLSGLTYPINPWNITTTNSSHNATGLVNVSALNNDHVICYHVNITVIDVNAPGAEDSQDVFLNISNTNDPPNVEVLSSYSNNTGGNNISSLVAFAESPFVYWVNATDIDQLTRFGDVLSFSNNDTSLFVINSTTGLISFIPNQSQIGNHTINISVTDSGGDSGGLSDYEIMSLEIGNNSAPVLQPIGNVSCAEDLLCTVIINASDLDNDNLTFTSNNTAVFSLTLNLSQNPRWSAYVNYTPNQSRVGNYSMVVTVTDIRGAFDNETFNFTINNTNDPPALQDFAFPKIVETHPVVVYVYADDDDYNLSSMGIYEYVTFNNTNLSGKNLFNITTYLNTTTNKTYGLIYFTPQNSSGNYSVNISATDYYNATTYIIKNFTVYPKTYPPNISQIMPYGRPVSSVTVFSFINTSNFSGASTDIDFSENTTVLYNLTVSDDTTPTANLTYAWYLNGTLVSTNSYLNRSYDFFSAGSQNVSVVVTDDTYETASWLWNITINDVNRAPWFNYLNPLPNITINSSNTYAFLDFLKDAGGVRFIDPDDDFDSDFVFDNGVEVSNLVYAATSCDAATISITGHDVELTPVQIGVCTVIFTARDPGLLTNTSNQVWINVTNVTNASERTPTPQPTTGGGGGQSRSIIIPMRKEESKPKSIEIIVPELVTIYANKTVLIPVKIQNNWNSTLKEIKINASSNASEIKLKFSEDYFQELKVGEQRDITLSVENYRLGENYNLLLTANVTTPKASDSAHVLLNTIEQAGSGEDVQTKVTFAQDLLNENPECLELNELLGKAKDALAEGSTTEASKMVDGVINGCKYLVSIAKKEEQKPESIVSKIFRKENIKFFLIFIGIAVIFTLAVLLVRKRKTIVIKEKEEEEKKSEENEVKPYWSP